MTASVPPASVSLSGHEENPSRAIVLMCLAVFSMALQDSTAKLLIADHSIVVIIFFRGIGGAVLLAPLFLRVPAGRRGVGPPGLFALRVLFMLGGIVGFVSALAYLPLAEATAISHLVPLIVAVLGAIFLGERIGPRRLAAVLAGLAGVLLVVRPGGDFFNIGALMAFGGIVSFCAMTITVRILARTVDLIALTFWTQIALSAVTVAAVPFFWAPISPGAWALMILQGLLSGVIQYLFSDALRLAPATTVAPFTYTNVVYMIALGYLLFGDLPQMTSLLGMGIVVGAGIYLWWRERRLHHGTTQDPVQSLGGPGESVP